MNNSYNEALRKAMCEFLLKYLTIKYQKKWNFYGEIRYPDKRSVDFEFAFNDGNSGLNLKISGKTEISDSTDINLSSVICEFQIKNIQNQNNAASEENDIECSFEVRNRDSFCVDFLLKISKYIMNNYSYNYFYNDYKKLSKQNPFDYLNELKESGLIEWEQLDDNRIILGKKYNVYIANYAEEKYILTISDKIFEEDASASDNIFISDDKNKVQIIPGNSLKIDIAGRLSVIFDYRYKNKFFNLIKDTLENIITVEDLIIRTTDMHCIYKGHHLQRIIALVCIETDGVINEESIEALYCAECDNYYISENEFQRISNKGRLCCQVFTSEEYSRSEKYSAEEWAQRSVLRSYGYNVNAQMNLSEDQRHEILSFMVENEIIGVDRAIDFISWLARRNTGRNSASAREKWYADIEYLRRYKKVNAVVRVKSIYRRQREE